MVRLRCGGDGSPRSRRKPFRVRPLIRFAPAATLILLLAAPQAHGSGESRAKINVIDASKAPEMWIFGTVLDAKDRPIPPNQVTGVEVWMNGRRVPGGGQAVPLKETEHGVAIAMVMCGTATCRGAITKPQLKGMQTLAKLARDVDVGTVWVYENNIRNLSEGKFVALEAAGGLASNARMSPTAYQSKWLSAVHDAVSLFGTYDKDLPANRIVVLLSDGLDGRDPTGRASEGRVRRIMEDAKKLNVRVHTVGYSADTDVGMGNLKLLSRKTGGTFRRAYRPSEIPILLKEIAAEIFYQHAIFAVPPVKERRSYGFYVSMLHRDGRLVSPRKPAYEVRVEETFFRWAYWGRIGLIALAVLLVLLLIVFLTLFLRRRRRRKQEMDKAYRQAMGEEVDEEPPEDAEEALEEAAQAVEPEAAAPKRRCAECGRIMLEDWAACMFCAAGIDGTPGSGGQ